MPKISKGVGSAPDLERDLAGEQLTHWDGKQTYEDLNARDPHETFIGAGLDEPAVCTPRQAEGEEVLFGGQLRWIERGDRETDFEDDKAGKSLD